MKIKLLTKLPLANTDYSIVDSQNWQSELQTKHNSQKNICIPQLFTREFEELGKNPIANRYDVSAFLAGDGLGAIYCVYLTLKKDFPIMKEDLSHSRAMWSLAQDFYKASRIVQEQSPHDRIAYFLSAHAIELTLKAFLRGKGFSIPQLKQFKKSGHDLEDILNKAEAQGLKDLTVISEQAHAALYRLNDYYESKDFEYPKIGPKNLPSPEEINLLIDQLLADTKNFCEEKEKVHFGKPTAETRWTH